MTAPVRGTLHLSLRWGAGLSDDVIYPIAGKRVWVAGHGGMVGSALARRLAQEACEILVAPRPDLDLTKQAEVDRWMARHRPDAIFIAAAKVGGIAANTASPVDFLYNNLMIAANILSAAHNAGVERLLLLGSSCVYPKHSPQPIPEAALLTGPLEPTNEWYAIAKIAGLKLALAYRTQYGDDFISAMPTNLYGSDDNFDLKTSHVLPALLRKAHEAKAARSPEMVVWGTGAPLREFLHVDDCADALVFLMQRYSGDEHVNVGSGEDLPISELAKVVADVVGFEGTVRFDSTQPDGTPRKLMSGEKLRAMGWRPRIGLREGIEAAYRWFLEVGARTT